MTQARGPTTDRARLLGSLFKAELATWLGVAIPLFIGWIVVLPLVASAPLARAGVIGVTGLAFSTITATVMTWVLKARTSVDGSALTTMPPDTVIFAYSRGFCRLLRFGRIFWPLLLLVSVVGLLVGVDGQSRVFVPQVVVFAFFFLVNWYVLGRLVEEVRASSRGLDVRMASGRSMSVRWDEITGLHIGRRRDRFRVDTTSRFGFSIESSMPGYPRLLQLIEERMQHSKSAG